MKIPYNILIQIKMSVRPYFKGFTLIFFFYNCRKQDCTSLLSTNNFIFSSDYAFCMHRAVAAIVTGNKMVDV